MPKVTYKLLYFGKSVFDCIFSQDGFCDICCDSAFLRYTELVSVVCQHDIVKFLVEVILWMFRTLANSSCLWQGASGACSLDFRLTSLLRITGLEHNACGQVNGVEPGF